MKLFYTIRNYFQIRYRLNRARREYSSTLYSVLLLAIMLHGSQRRRYTHHPYWFHVESVMRRLMRNGVKGERILAAALLHDTLEDVKGLSEYGLLVLLKRIYAEDKAREVLRLVVHLTDEYTHEKYPQLKRAQRKRLEVARFSGAAFDAKRIKLADIEDNTNSIKKYDQGFYESCYRDEKEALYNVIVESDIELLWFATDMAA